MKLTVRNSISGLIGLLALLFSLYGCKQEDRVTKANMKVNNNTSVLNKASCNCKTDLSDCPACVTEFMAGQTSKTYSIDWLSCIGPDGPCEDATITTIDFCVENTLNNSCGLLCAIIHNPPSCLPCLSDNMRLELPISCSNEGYWVISLSSGDGIVINASGDPKFNVTCKNGITGFDYSCVGDMY